MRNNKISKGDAVPWLWLNDGEEYAQADNCACVLVRNYNNGGPAVFLCPKHAAAPELLAALEIIAQTAIDYPDNAMAHVNAQTARAAIARAKGE